MQKPKHHTNIPLIKTTTKLQCVINYMSDTITCPTPGMRQAIPAAQVGDDVYGMDPTVKRLQKVMDDLLDKEDAMLVPSDAISNLIDIGTHCNRGDEIICGNNAHIFCYEGANAAAYMGVSPAILPNQAGGTIKLSDMANAVRANDIHYPRTTLVETENTHNTCGGREFIHRANRLRKSLGSSLRQSGFLAAAGLYALENQFERLADDHANAKALAEGLALISGIEDNPDDVDTNTLFWKVSSEYKMDTATLVKRVADENSVIFGG
ncbi:hypothetical protein BBO99_00009009 [Phytophthora kernoviae]|uniref:Aromatic amino acid beta-eliminating lyase/threonine aldolase domain-containing protein n=2 Tax=Phytophthora kernoviae TaxID=325452 RepID=A0A3R7GKH9_9STRA|nr:hypothetical protein G195_009813 [Phytophthora kernoviae 00238/432]KAG2507271.1 hypothetical protein JM16_009044 [Phytophthora kernoviae]KAG2509578.1 hypothetical protein JM18_008904 [Phytophthora kernoviae]RLN11147.1 hypothetical protein BBI17_009006 [Phytophthora kernoviae]RLN74290.1 hypothetical protein BBO99_00009009 [Phytophthora kernoviae]